MGRRRRNDEIEAALARAVEAGRQLERQQMLANTARVIFGEELAEVIDALSGGFSSALAYISEAVSRWVARWRERTTPVLLQGIQTSEIQTDRGNVRLSFDLANPKLREFFDDYTLTLATQITDTTREKLEGIIREGSETGKSVEDVAKQLREAGEEFGGYRATLIARTELHRAATKASEIQARESGAVVSRTWLSASDDRVRPLHRALNGKTVGMDEEFAPGVMSPGDAINCRCTLLFGIDPEVTT